MRTLRLTVKRSLFGLFGMMVLAVACFSSTIPAFVERIAQERENGIATKPALKLVSRHSGSATAKTTSAAAGHKHHDSSDRAAAVRSKTITARKLTTTQQEKVSPERIQK
jgi:hypothetical protein